MIESRSSRGLREFQHEGKWKQEHQRVGEEAILQQYGVRKK
jgi:hypothetical protein